MHTEAQACSGCPCPRHEDVCGSRGWAPLIRNHGDDESGERIASAALPSENEPFDA